MFCRTMSINKVTILFLRCSAYSFREPGVITKLNIVLIMADDGYGVSALTGARNFLPPPRCARGHGHALRALPSTPLCTPSRVNLMTESRTSSTTSILGCFLRVNRPLRTISKPGVTQQRSGEVAIVNDSKRCLPREAGFDRHCVWNIPGTERSRYWKPSLMHDGKVMNHGEDDYGRRSSPIT